MASHHMLAAGFCLLIVCAAQLSTSLPLTDADDTTLDDSLDTEKELIGADETDSTLPQANVSSTLGQKTSTTPQKTEETTQNSTQAATSNSAPSSTESPTASKSPSTSYTTATSSVAEEASKTESNPGKDSDVVVEEKVRFWWSESTWWSIVVPVCVGLGCALLLILWICCVRKICCRRCSRYRSPPYKQRPKSTAGPAKKAIREDFRQLRARDRIKLLAESSDEEF